MVKMLPKALEIRDEKGVPTKGVLDFQVDGAERRWEVPVKLPLRRSGKYQ